jgi:oligoribonuclease NrnB/cAMP/cGMP phosphodiesterase (DHH superfamily)
MHHLLHHANCADGFAAACIARHALLTQGILAGDLNVQPVNYGQPDQMPLGKDGILFPGDTVTYLDYTPPQDTLDAFFAEHGTSRIPLTIIDHHLSAAPRHDAHARFLSVFALGQSGASLAWSYFHTGAPMPRAIELIQWRDLGHAFDPTQADDPRTPDALNLHAYLFRCLPRTFEAWTPLLLENSPVNQVNNSQPPSTPLSAAIQIGSRLRAIDRSIILSAVANPHWLNFHGEEIPAVNGLDAGLISDACTELLRAYPTAPFAASWFIDAKTGKATYSLRSRRNSTVNVAEIAAAMAPGGGGHPNAAGFSTLHPIPFV